MKDIRLLSRWFDLSLNLRVSDLSALAICKDGMSIVNDDLDRYSCGLPTKFLSKHQCRKIIRFFANDNINYFDTVVVVGRSLT